MKHIDKEEWIENVFGSLSGSERAKPSLDLFGKIEGQLNDQEAKIIPFKQWRIAAAITVLLISTNIFSLQKVAQTNIDNTANYTSNDSANESLISNYYIYK